MIVKKSTKNNFTSNLVTVIIPVRTRNVFVKEAIESTNNTQEDDTESLRLLALQQQQQILPSTPATNERRQSTVLLSAKVGSNTFKGKSLKSTLDTTISTSHMWQRDTTGGSKKNQQASSGVTALTASNTTAIELEPQSPRHTFKFRKVTVNRILVICFEMGLYGYGANEFDDLVQRSFLKALQIRLDLDEDLAVGCHLSTTKTGAVQHSPYRVHIHVSIEAQENGHDVAEELMQQIELFRDIDIGRSGHQKSNLVIGLVQI